MALYEVYVDGAARQGTNFSQSAVGVVIFRNRKRVWDFARGLGHTTNNRAEYEAVLAGLIMCWSSEEIKDPIIYSDSQLVVNQVNGIWRCENPSLLPLLFSIKLIQREYRFRLQKVPRAHVAVADQLCNKFLDELFAEIGENGKIPEIPEIPPPPI